MDIRNVMINGEERRVLVSFVYPPIPVRNFDYSATDYDTYDGSEDCNCPHGHGATAQEAIDDLVMKTEERAAIEELES